MFALTLEKADMVKILSALKDRIGLFPLETMADGIEMATFDDGKNMVVWLRLGAELMEGYDFNTTDETEKEEYNIPSDTLVNALKGVSYPLEMGSLMDGCIKVNSSNGRQTFKIIPERNVESEDSNYHRDKYNSIIEDGNYLKIKILRQDFYDGVRTAKIGGDQIKMTLEENAMLLSTVDSTIEADAVVPLVESVETNGWSHSYNVKLLNYVLGVSGDNVEIPIYLLHDSDQFMIDIPLGDDSFCRMVVAAVSERTAEEGSD